MSAGPDMICYCCVYAENGDCMHLRDKTKALFAGTIALEDRATADGRFMRPGALKWRLPLPVIGIVRGWRRSVGSVEQIERRENGTIHAEGWIVPAYLDLEYLADTGIYDPAGPSFGAAIELGSVRFAAGAPGTEDLRSWIAGAQLDAVFLTDRPAWPQSRIALT